MSHAVRVSSIKATELRRGMRVRVAGTWRKIARVTVFFEFIAVGFANGDSIRWPMDRDCAVSVD